MFTLTISKQCLDFLLGCHMTPAKSMSLLDFPWLELPGVDTIVSEIPALRPIHQSRASKIKDSQKFKEIAQVSDPSYS